MNLLKLYFNKIHIPIILFVSTILLFAIYIPGKHSSILYWSAKIFAIGLLTSAIRNLILKKYKEALIQLSALIIIGIISCIVLFIIAAGDRSK